jgi:hypothetical protein
MNCKEDLERRSHGLIVVLSYYLPQGTEENHKKPIRLAGFPWEILSQYHLTTDLEHCYYTKLLGYYQVLTA